MTDEVGGATPLDEILAGDDPSAALTDWMVGYLASLDAGGEAQAHTRLRDRWPRAGCWRDLRSLVRAKRRKLREAEKHGENWEEEDAADERPEIDLSDELHVAVSAAERALATSEAEVFFQGGGVGLVRIMRASNEERRGNVWREAGAPTLGVAPPEWLASVLSCAARWYVWRKGEDGGHEKVYKPGPTKEIVAALRQQSTFQHLRFLAGVSDGPVLRQDGTLATTPGYDPTTGQLITERVAVYPPVPPEPSREEALIALEMMLEPTEEFPFVDDVDRSAAAALALTLLARPAIPGPVPLWAVTAPTAGTGKSLLAGAAVQIGTGRRPAIVTWPRRSEEARKSLLALAVAGDAAVLVDNIEGDLASAELAAALTAGEIRDRLLGESKMVTAPWSAVLIATGNNLTLKGDLARRVVPVRMDARCEAPDERGGWKRPDLTAFVRKHRPRLAVAGLTVLRAHAAAGRPRPEGLGPPLGSFEAWDQQVRAAVAWVGLPDPLGRRAELRAADPERESFASLLHAWRAWFGEDAATARGAIDAASTDLYGDEESKEIQAGLREAVAGVVRKGPPTTQTLGYALRKLAGRPVEGLILESAGRCSTTRAVTWRVLEADVAVPTGVEVRETETLSSSAPPEPAWWE